MLLKKTIEKTITLRTSALKNNSREHFTHRLRQEIAGELQKTRVATWPQAELLPLNSRQFSRWLNLLTDFQTSQEDSACSLRKQQIL